MSSRVGLYRQIYRMIEPGLCGSGMRRHSKGVYSRGISPEATGVVGLNVATKYGFSINPIIGVQYLPLETLLAELKGRDFHPTKSGDSIAKAIGYLSKPFQFREWTFVEGDDNTMAVADMVNEITTVGFRYMEANQTIEAICDRIAKDGHFMMGNDVYQLPVGYLMLGRFDAAERIVRDKLSAIAEHKGPTIEELEATQGEKLLPEVIAYLEKTKDDPIPAHENYRRFAEQFFHRLDEERSRPHG